MFISALDRGSLAVAIPEIMKDFKFDPAVMGVALSAFFWSYAVCNLPAGNAADRFGSKTVLGWAAAIWSLTSAATGLVRNSFGLVMARVGVGAAEAATYPVCAKIVAETFPSKERGTAIGWYLSGARLGLAATPLVISFLIARWSWRTAFIITGLLGLSWCAVWYLGFHDASRRPSVGAAPPNLVIPWRKLLGNRCALGLFIAKFLQDYVYFMFITWLPAYLMLERGFSQTQTGVYASLPFFAAFIAQPLVGHTSDWLIRRGVSVTKARKFTLLGCQICTATVIAVGFVANPMAAVVLLVINVAGEAGIGGMMFTIGAEVSPPQMTGSFLGAMNTVGAASGILAPILTGFIVKTSGSFRIALAVGSCFIAIAAFSIFFVVQEIKPLELCERSSSAVQT
jgi:ACS family glucarate transporter-like MFS transporter